MKEVEIGGTYRMHMRKCWSVQHCGWNRSLKVTEQFQTMVEQWHWDGS